MRTLAPRLALAVLLAAGLALPARAADSGGVSFGGGFTSSGPADPLAGVRARVKAKDYAGCLNELRSVPPSAQDADYFNLTGFCLRKTGNQQLAFAYYRKALELNPQHKGTLEYLGELYVETGQLDKARENAAALRRLCPRGCEELSDLNEAITRANSARR